MSSFVKVNEPSANTDRFTCHNPCSKHSKLAHKKPNLLPDPNDHDEQVLYQKKYQSKSRLWYEQTPVLINNSNLRKNQIRAHRTQQSITTQSDSDISNPIANPHYTRRDNRRLKPDQIHHSEDNQKRWTPPPRSPPPLDRKPVEPTNVNPT